MNKETEEIMRKLTLPPPPTQKNQRVGCYRNTPAGEKKEAHRLFKSMKAGFLKEEDLTEHGIYLLKKYYPFMR